MSSSNHAITRFEVLAVIAGLAMLALPIVSSVCGSISDSRRAVCYNNLRRIGRAAQLWGAEREDRLPWEISVHQGGTRPDSFSKYAAAWTEFIALSNELQSPRLLACPADPTVKVASDWSTAKGGFANSAFRPNAVSYFINFHCQPLMARAVFSGDRDFRPSNYGPLSCARGPVNTAGLAPQDRLIAWTNEVHSSGGHILFVDGSTEFVGNERLYSIFGGSDRQTDTGANIHFINAR